MNERRGIIRLHNNDDHIRYRRQRAKQNNSIPFIMPEPIMPKEVEKEIILDAISSFILSCDTKETDEFIKEVTNRIISTCILVYGSQSDHSD
ncbi:MAG: hypothetical protein ACPL7B_09555 [Candidatus Poribacteria bacterium]